MTRVYDDNLRIRLSLEAMIVIDAALDEYRQSVPPEEQKFIEKIQKRLSDKVPIKDEAISLILYICSERISNEQQDVLYYKEKRDEILGRAIELRKVGMSWKKIARQLDIPRNTLLYRRKIAEK